jgi:hypothetical protein
MYRQRTGDGGFALDKDGADLGGAGAGGGAVTAMAAGVAVARLAAAFSLKSYPGLLFRTHSILMNCHPPPFGAASHGVIVKGAEADVDKRGRAFAAQRAGGVGEIKK